MITREQAFQHVLAGGVLAHGHNNHVKRKIVDNVWMRKHYSGPWFVDIMYPGTPSDADLVLEADFYTLLDAQ